MLQLEQQRETYSKLLRMTEARVVEANKNITNSIQAGEKDEEKRKAAQFLADQVNTLYEDRNALVAENDKYKEQVR